MRNPKHTRGPWLADPKPKFTNVGPRALYQVARVYLTETEEGAANLRLVQSAPDLFEVVEGLLALAEAADPHAPAVGRARELFLFIDPQVNEIPFPAFETAPFPTEVT